METINLNLIPTGARPVLHASQYDKGRQFRANLFDGSAVYTLTGAETLSIAVRKPDGHVVTEGITNTSDSYVIIETTEQMTACAGDSFAEVKIEEGGDLLGTLNLILAVEQSPEAGGDPSESFIYNLETQIADAVADQYDSNAVIFDAAPTAGHGVGYAVTSEGVLAAIPTDLDDLNDVETTAPAQGEALVWDGTKWVNGTVSTVGNLDDLSDVDTTGKQEGDSLRYIGGEWKAKPTTVEMTQAEYDAIVDFTPYANTHIVITDAPNLNPTASDIEYSSGVSVADELTSLDTALGGKAKKTWTTLGTITEGGTALNISGYSELLIYPKINGTTYFNTYVVDVAEFSNTNVIHFSIYQDSTHSYMGALDYSSNTINLRKVLIEGWTNCICIVKAR
ncbi:MAG: hypothetical protein J6S14_14725 [Clostridia bacterium]|nr:hypothetical protein [Clostridia bacterium]